MKLLLKYFTTPKSNNSESLDPAIPHFQVLFFIVITQFYNVVIF